MQHSGCMRLIYSRDDAARTEVSDRNGHDQDWEYGVSTLKTGVRVCRKRGLERHNVGETRRFISYCYRAEKCSFKIVLLVRLLVPPHVLHHHRIDHAFVSPKKKKMKNYEQAIVASRSESNSCVLHANVPNSALQRNEIGVDGVVRRRLKTNMLPLSFDSSFRWEIILSS